MFHNVRNLFLLSLLGPSLRAKSAATAVTLHSFDFTKYRLWTSLFRRGTIVNGQIVVCSFDLTEYHL